MAPEDIDNSAGERGSPTAKRVKPIKHAAEQGIFPQPWSSPSSREKAAAHLRECRLGLMYQIPVYHPIWSRVKVGGELGEDEPESDSDETIAVVGSEDDDSSGGVPTVEEGGDWWDEMDEAIAKEASGEERVVYPVEEGTNETSQVGDEQDVPSEEE
jgi:hypothetical protein